MTTPSVADLDKREAALRNAAHSLFLLEEDLARKRADQARASEEHRAAVAEFETSRAARMAALGDWEAAAEGHQDRLKRQAEALDRREAAVAAREQGALETEAALARRERKIEGAWHRLKNLLDAPDGGISVRRW